MQKSACVVLKQINKLISSV